MHNIMRPPSDPIQSVSTYVNHFKSFLISFEHIIMPKLGILGFIITIFVFILSAISVIKKLLKVIFGFNIQKLKILNGLKNTNNDQYKNSNEKFLRIYFSLFLGLTIGSLLLLEMIVPFYVSMGMPLLGILFVLSKGYVTGILFEKSIKKRNTRRQI